MNKIIEQQRKKIEELTAILKKDDELLKSADNIIKGQRDLIEVLTKEKKKAFDAVEAIARIGEYKFSGVWKLLVLVVKYKIGR